MKTFTQRCSQRWQTLIAGGFKTFLVLFLLSFFVTSTNAQITVDGNPSTAPNEWCTPLLPSSVRPHLHVKDILNGSGDDTEFNQGTSDVLNIPDWHWGLGNISGKTDLGNVGLVIDNCTIYFFADRFAAEGDADLGLWLFKDPAFSLNPDGTFNGMHLEGDVLLTSKFTNGGGVQTTKVYVWQNGALVLLFDTALDPSKENIAGGAVNTTESVVPCGWSYTGKFPDKTKYQAGTFFEGYLNLCDLNLAYPNLGATVNECFSTFIFKTSQSQSPTSSNGDLVFGSINSLPAKLTLRGSIFCTSAGNTGTVAFDNSVVGVSYTLQQLVSGVYVDVANTTTAGTGNTITYSNLAAGTYRVKAVNVNTRSLCTTYFDPVDVTSVTANGGTGSTDQTICGPSGDPSLLSITGASAGTYQWQSNTTGCNGPWVNINNATSATYDPPAGLMVTTYYRRVTTVTSGSTTCPANSTCITVTINNVTGGTGSADQTLCGPSADPGVLSITLSTSTQATPTYQWQSNTTGCGGTWVNIPSATGATYDPPAGLTTTTYYRRVTTSTVNSVACSANSSCITVTINNVTGGTGSADQTLCGPADPAILSVTGSTATQTTPTYQWQSNTAGCGSAFTNISGATAATYDPPAGLTTTTYYRRVTTSTVNSIACTATSTCIIVNIGGINAGTIAASQALCSPANPALFTSTADATPAPGAPAPTYQWESKLGTCESNNAWAPIAGATSATYDAPAGLNATTSYRRVATSTLNGVPCSANSNCITVTVTQTPAAPILSKVDNCEATTITAKDANGVNIPAGELTWTGTSQTGNPIMVITTAPITATRTVGGCTSPASNSITPAPTPRPGAPTGIPGSGCIGQQVTLGASGCTGTYTWYDVPTGGTSKGTGSTFVTPALTENKTYYVSCTVNGCEGPRAAVTASVTACGAFCTYTQGAWGTKGGKMCDGTTGGYSTTGLLDKLFTNWGATGLIIGSNGNTVKLTASQCILDLLPGGGKSYVLNGAATTCEQIKSKYAKLLPSGYKIDNTLLAQTITLGLNLGINGNLASFSFATHSATNKYLITAALVSCGSTSVVPNSNTCDLIDPDVIALLKRTNWPASGNGDYPATVAGLYSLANYALGGQSLVGTGVTLESIAGVVDAINNAFDECRAFVNFAPACPLSLTNRVITPETESAVAVTASPNPYTDRIRFVITSTVSGQGSLEIYNSMGQKVAIPFQGYINAGRSQTVEYNVPTALRNNIFYRLSVKDKSVSGKVLNVGK